MGGLCVGGAATGCSPHPRKIALSAPAPFVARLGTALFNIVPALAFMTTVLFWILDYRNYPADRPLLVLDVLLHGGNLLVALVDIAFSLQPFRLARIVYLVAFLMLYLLFTLCFTFGGFTISSPSCTCPVGTVVPGCKPADPSLGIPDTCNYVYASLNFNRPAEAAMLALAVLLVASPLAHLAVGCLVYLSAACSSAQRSLIAGVPEPPAMGGLCARAIVDLRAEHVSVDERGLWLVQWAHSPYLTDRSFLLLRWCLLVLWTWVVAANIQNRSNNLALVAFLTNWGLFAQWAYLALAVYLTDASQRIKRAVTMQPLRF